MEPSQSKPRGRPRKIDREDDDVRVILDDYSNDSSDDASVFRAPIKEAQWTSIV